MTVDGIGGHRRGRRENPKCKDQVQAECRKVVG